MIDDFARFEHQSWQRVADKYDSVWSSLTGQFIPSLLEDTSVSAGMLALDVACGPGYVSAAAKQLGVVPTGIDFSEKMIGIAKRMFSEIRFRQGDAQDLPFEDGSFDSRAYELRVVACLTPRKSVRRSVPRFEKGRQVWFYCLGGTRAEPGREDR